MIFKPKIKNYKILGIHPFYIWFNQNRIQIVEKRPYKNPAWNHKKPTKMRPPGEPSYFRYFRNNL